ncbi:MAG: DEAD/DEAH box helicase [Planctomycetia bacterium]|nr:DEAD/DEAH box helicase [Planctomycetia bacterium]
MNVFDLRQTIVNDYNSFITGEINIRDKRIDAEVRKALDSGLLWPAATVQLNPAYKSDKTITDLVNNGVLDPGCDEIFRIREEGKASVPLRLYQHQVEAIARANRGEHYLLTTGVGSGKSLAYIIPIVNYALRCRRIAGAAAQGVKAIIVYPMNALANSQKNELEKFLRPEITDVTFHVYTGQESQDDRAKIRDNPPDIILTNYVMLEYILTRGDDQKLVEKMQGLRFLVLDELHSYRGRQGADIALLTRRVREACGYNGVAGAQSAEIANGAQGGARKLICIGTSATLAAGETAQETRAQTAKVASLFFGEQVSAENVITETLERESKVDLDLHDAQTQESLKEEIAFLSSDACKLFDDSKEFDEKEGAVLSRPAEEYLADAQKRNSSISTVLTALQHSALPWWIETTFGLCKDAQGEWVRQIPRPLEGKTGAALELAQRLGLNYDDVVTAVKRLFLLGYYVKNEQGRPYFSFRLHQFIGKGDHVYATAELGEDRQIYMRKQIYAPGTNRQKKLFPLVFCQMCGKEYYCVTRVWSGEESEPHRRVERFEPRDPFTVEALIDTERNNVGYLYMDKESWPNDPEEAFERMPDSWKDGKRLKDSESLPKNYVIDALGYVVTDTDSPCYAVSYIVSPLQFCPCCGVAYSKQHVPRKYMRSDDLTARTISTGGRSSATTILALSCLSQLRQKGSNIPKRAQKLLSFSDNRQDAALQSGHLNDFVHTSVLRWAVYNVLREHGAAKLGLLELASEVFQKLKLRFEDFGINPETAENFQGRAGAALKTYLTYQILCDLPFGWRESVPNLQNVGLTQITFADLEEAAEQDDLWQNVHEALRDCASATRKLVLELVLQKMLQELAINWQDFQNNKIAEFIQTVKNNVNGIWGFDLSATAQTVKKASSLQLTSSTGGKSRAGKSSKYSTPTFNLSPSSGVARAIGRILSDSDDKKFKTKELEEILNNLISVLFRSDLIRNISKESSPRYQVNYEKIEWSVGDDHKPHDYVRIVQDSKYGAQSPVNEFFREYYRTRAEATVGIESHEHTAQASYQDRREREEQFREAELPILFCSPTMELGVDISELNVVHMRNVPPTPANYAQRSGRAGRNGHPALVMVYCAAANSHDQYYFARPDLMISGSVKAPQIDLTNEELLRTHAHAIWLEEVVRHGRRFPSSINDLFLLDEKDDEGLPTCPLAQNIESLLGDAQIVRLARQRVRDVMTQYIETEDITKFLDDVFGNLRAEFDKACDRWRNLYRDVARVISRCSSVFNDGSKNNSKEVKDAELAQSRALATRNYLLNQDHEYGNQLSEYYIFRYLATEGFLPGYNFPRLPVLADLTQDSGSQTLERSRFIAISEFAPRAYVYHEGARYQIARVTSAPMVSGQEGERSTTAGVQGTVCEVCGYFNPARDDTGKPNDCCAHCNRPLNNGGNEMLLRMDRVEAERRDGISCDEEERQRFGYDVVTSLEFAKKDGRVECQRGDIILPSGQKWGALFYGKSATIYRLNRGYRHSGKINSTEPNPGLPGFNLNFDTLRWAPNSVESADAQASDNRLFQQDNQKDYIKRVIPYVSDVKNCLLLEPDKSANLDDASFVSLMSALRRAIERIYSVEEREISTFILPSAHTRFERGDVRRSMLFYEASEGGVGVLNNVFREDSLQQIFREALELCHFNEDGSDRMENADAHAKCDAACYDCLLSYTNQPDHALLDRKAIRDTLLALIQSTLKVSSTSKSREELFEALKDKTQSELERRWLCEVHERQYLLPTEAQGRIKDLPTIPDFVYAPSRAAIFIDGAPHDDTNQRKKDEQLRADLLLYGYRVIVFRYDDDWDAIFKANSDVFYT